MTSFKNVQKMTLGGNTLKDTSSMLQHKDLLDVGCVCVCMSVFMSERKFWNSELLLYFSTTSGNSASHTQQRNTIPVRKDQPSLVFQLKVG